ncbi:MAG: YicC family protein [Oscillospiraceae bacterium]|nr:YicC family protein [Oscillospiraceae bacterium]
MIRSMTGFGRAQETVDGLNITFEIKSVNHRYFECSSRVPRAYGFLDEKIKTYLQGFISRGKVECFVQIEALEDAGITVSLNAALAAGYLNAFKELSGRFMIGNDVTASTFARFGDIFSVRKQEYDEEKIWNAVKLAAEIAVSSFLRMREAEGEKLSQDVLRRADTILDHVAFIEERSPQTVREYNEKLLKRMREVLEDVHVDEQRLLTEAAIFADKIAVDEETVRLRSHIAQLREFFRAQGAIGRKLDFLVQEINREANTIGSKAQDAAIASRVIEVKSEIEKIREQIQNIE